MDDSVEIPKSRIHLPSLKILFVLVQTTMILFATGPSLAADLMDPVARVNGITLYQYDLSHAVEFRRFEIGGIGPATGHIDQRKTLDRLIDIELLYQESLKHRFHGLVEEAQERYQREVRRLGGKKRFMSALECNKITPDQFRKTIYRNLSIKRLLDEEIYSRIEIKEDQAREYYERNKGRFQKPPSVRIRQILIRVPSGSGENGWKDAEKKALAIYRDASSGADFVRLVRRHSEDPASASTGGDEGLIQEGNLKAMFDSRIFSMKPGTVTKPIRSPEGFHIIKVVSSTPAATKTFEEVKGYITTLLRRQQAREMITGLISSLKSEAEIEILFDRERSPINRPPIPVKPAN